MLVQGFIRLKFQKWTDDGRIPHDVTGSCIVLYSVWERYHHIMKMETVFSKWFKVGSVGNEIVNSKETSQSLAFSEESSQSRESSLALSMVKNLKDNGDWILLYELIWGITHDNNTDHNAKDVLLLCYPLVINAKYVSISIYH